MHTPTLFECQYCVFASQDKSTVEKHGEEEHAKRIICQVCEDYVKDETSLKEHTDSTHKIPEPFPCDLCGLVLANYLLLHNHINNDHTPTLISCQYCEFTTDDKENLQTHMVDTHEEVVVLYTIKTRTKLDISNVQSFTRRPFKTCFLTYLQNRHVCPETNP